MSDPFLEALRREPRPEFARALRTRLESEERAPARRLRFAPRARGWVAAFAGVLAVAVLFTVPAMRASAQAFLDLFRVRNFAAVEVSPERLRQFEDGSIDLKGLLGGQVESLRDPGEPSMVESPAAAAAAAGIAVLEPTFLPDGLTRREVWTQGASEVRITVSAEKLRQLGQSLGVPDVHVPQAVDGQVLSVRTAPLVGIKYARDRLWVVLMQAASPEVTLPHGVDLAELGEMGLQFAGLPAGEARRFARSVDWRSTLLIPVPANASSFREVTVLGRRALLITTGDAGGHRREGAVLMWSDGDKVFGLHSDVSRLDLVQIANSLR